MDPRHLVYLSEIIGLGSMSRAARRLNVAQPTLSRVVRIIEDRVGSPVLRRGRYGVTPTTIGEQLAKQGRAIADCTDMARDIIDQWKHGLTGELTVGVGPMLASTIMTGFFEKAFQQNWPYSIQVISETAARSIEALNEGHLDAAILPARLNLPQESLAQELLFKDQVVVIAGAKSKIALSDRIHTLAELANLPWVETAAISGLYGSLQETLAKHGLEEGGKRLKFSGDVQMALNVVANSSALCFLPERQLAMLRNAQDFKILRVDTQLPPRDIAFWTSKSAQDNPAVQHFRVRLKSHLSETGFQ